MNRYIKKLLKKLHLYKSKESGTISLIGSNHSPVKVCDIVNGKPQVIREDSEDTITFTLRYSAFRKVVKRYDKETFKEL